MQKSKDQIKEEYMNTIADYEARIRLWKAVKRVTKKDGSDFQNFAKNFENAKIERGRICSDDFEINVSDYSVRIAGKWVSDNIDIRQVVKYSKITPNPDQIQKVKYLEDFFYMTPEQTMQMIQYRIESYENQIQECKDQIEQLDNLYEYVTSHVTEIMDHIKSVAGSNNHLYYEMRKLIQEVGY